MKLEILGSGGAVTTPKPFCDCAVCQLARNSDAPQHSRFGPSVFVHGPDVLIDTPEEIKLQINRSTITSIAACVFSHWHPDHTMGHRFLEHNIDWLGMPPQHGKTKVIIPKTVATSFENRIGIMQHFEYYLGLGIVDLSVVADDELFELNGYMIRPIKLAIDYVFGYDIRSSSTRILVIMDELKGWEPSEVIAGTPYDLVYLPIGVFDLNPISGERIVAADHPILNDEQALAETIEIMRKLDARSFVLSHIEELDGISYELGNELSTHMSAELGTNVKVAYDTMMVEL